MIKCSAEGSRVFYGTITIFKYKEVFMQYTNLTKEQLKELLDSAKKEYEEIAAKGYKVDIARGKPCNAQAMLAYNMLTSPAAEGL